MPYSFDDFQAEYTQNVIGENFASEVAGLQVVTAQEAHNLFPEIAVSDSPSLVYFPFRLCHSLPTINKRGRCFTGPTLARSFATAVDSLIDVDHLIRHNNLSESDFICGHIKAAKFQLGELASIAEVADVPPAAIPVLGLGCLYLRAQGIQDIVQKHIRGNEKWAISMECGHSLTETAVYWNGSFIPLPEADEILLRGIKPTSMPIWRDKQTALALGGTKGKVDLWGAALTRNPADGDANIFHFVAAKTKEAANVPNGSSFMPFRFFPGTALEVASVETKINEIASISILGETDEAEGHRHLILSDTTIMPANGHTHYVKSIGIKQGTKPALTGVTDPHHDYVRSSSDAPSQGIVHQHTFNIALDKKNKTTPAADTEITLTPEAVANLEKIGEIANMAKSLTELLADLSTKVGEIATAKDASVIATKQVEIASINREIAQINSESAFTQRVEAEIDSRIKAGSLLRKEVADANVTTAVTAAVKEANEKAEAEKKAIEKKAARIEAVRTAGIDPNFGLPGLLNTDQTPMTIGDVVNGLGSDDAGERTFTINMATWKAMKEQAEKAAGVKAAADQQGQQQGQQKEAANTGRKVSTSILLAAGGGATKGEQANDGRPPIKGSRADHSRGKSRFANLR